MNKLVSSEQASVPSAECIPASGSPPDGFSGLPAKRLRPAVGRGGGWLSTVAKVIAGTALAVGLAVPLGAQIGGTPVYSIFAPATGVQSNTQQGTAVAVGGGFVAVGCPYDFLTDTGVGVVKIYSSGNGTLLYVLRCPSPAQGEHFGSALAMYGTRLVVGDPNYTPSSLYSAAGRAYIYNLASATPTTPIVTLDNPSPRSADRFGFAVSISNNIVVAGVPYRTINGVSNAGCAYVFDLGGATPTTAKYTLQKTTPASGDNFGYSVGMSGNRIVVGVPNDSPSGFQRAGAAYLYDLTTSAPATAVFRLINPNGATAANDSYGNAVAISDSWVAIGAYSGGDGNGGDGSGAVYIYNLASATATTPFATLRDPKKPGTAYSGFFGSAVAVDGTRVVVGAPYENLSGVQQAGSVFEFNMGSSTPATATLIIDDPTPVYQDRFGTAVAIAGSQVIVGAPLADVLVGTTGYTDAGSAYIYNNTTAPSYALNKTSPTSNDRFGSSVSTSVGYLAVGTPLDPTTGASSGSAAVYVLSGGNPPSPYLNIPNPDPAHITLFGRSVCMSGTLVAIGAAYNDGTGGDAGIVYVFNVRAQHPLDPYATLKNPNSGLYYHFGLRVVMAGNRLVVGMSSGAQGYGSAFAYDLSVSGTAPVATLYNPEAVPNDYFGASVALYGATAVVGAPGYSVGNTQSVGRVYVFNLASANPGYASAIIDNPNAVANSRLGDAVAVFGTRIVVGMPYYNVGNVLGRALVFDLASATSNMPVAILNHPYNGYGDSFGTSVSISGQLVAVGGPDDPLTDPNNLSSAGRVFVFSLAGTNPGVPVRIFDNPTPQAHETFGASVSIDDATVVVGTPGENTVAPAKGAVYSYDLSAILQVAANPAAGGTVSGGGGTYTIGSSQTISATANSGWGFVGWSDGSTQNPRTVGVPGDGTVLKADFAPANYNAWQSYYFTAQQIANPAVSGPTANPTGDEVNNFFKFYFGFNPTTPLSQADRAALPTCTAGLDGGNPVAVFTFRRNAAAASVPVNLQLLTGTTTTSWTNITPDSTMASAPDPVTGFQAVTMKVSVASRTRMILRLQAAP